MNRALIQALAGAGVAGVGFAAMAGLIPAIRDFTYPIVWWGVLAVVDAANLRFRRCSLWNGQAGRFFGVVVPVSVLFWLFFEALNLAAPQWHYFGGIGSVAGQVLFGFAAFSTVIPIVAEFWVLVTGEVCLPQAIATWAAERKALLAMAACILLVIPLANNVFWFNQGMWLVPALVVVPFWPPAECRRSRNFLLRVAAAGVLAGFFWEAFNWGSRTHWEYLILRDWPHLFQMPLLGYVGFIPFAASALAVYEAQKRIPARPGTVLLLYTAAFALQTAMTIIYVRRGLWIPLA